MKKFCKIFGHKYIQTSWFDKETEQHTYKRFNFCLRCGEYEKAKEPNTIDYRSIQDTSTI